MNVWTGTPKSTKTSQTGTWKEENAHQSTSEPVAILPPTPRQTRFGLVTPPNETNNLAIPVFDLACASMPGLEFQPCGSMLDPPRQACPEVLLALLLVRQLDEVNIYMCHISPELHKRHLHTCCHVRGHDDHLCIAEVEFEDPPVQLTYFDRVVESWVQIWQSNLPPFVPPLQVEKCRFEIVFGLLMNVSAKARLPSLSLRCIAASHGE
jgi:hypothetical protein